MTEQQFELIERYVRDEMLPTELNSFERRLSAEPKLNAEVEEIRTIIRAAKRAEIQERIAKARQEDLLQRREEKVTRLSSRKVMSLAAGFLILVVAGVIFSQQWWSQQPNQLASAYFEPATGLPTTLGISSNSAFMEGMIDYKLGDFPAAVTRWEKLRVEEKPSDTLRYFLGVAHLANGQPDKALEEFALVNNESALRSGAQWYSALANLKKEEVDKAKELLEMLSKQPGSFRNQATDLLSKL